jgi:hypothetical protein
MVGCPTSDRGLLAFRCRSTKYPITAMNTIPTAMPPNKIPVDDPPPFSYGGAGAAEISRVPLGTGAFVGLNAGGSAVEIEIGAGTAFGL